MADCIDAYRTHLAHTGRSPGTVELYLWLLRRLDRELPQGLTAANTEEIETWLYTGERSPATLALYRAIIGGYFGWANDPRVARLDWNPTAYLPDRAPVPRRAPRPLTRDQVGDILARARQPYRTWIVLATWGGLRCCEIAALDRGHITEATMWVHGKGSHERVIPTDAYVWAAVKDLPPGPVARNRDGTRATRQRVRARANDHLHDDLHHTDVTMHRFRHTAATWLLAATGDIMLVKAFLGHASVATTQIYTEVATTAMAAAVAALPRLTCAGGGVVSAP